MKVGLALIALAVTRKWRNPQLAHALWLLVLMKLVTPAVLPLPLLDSSVLAQWSEPTSQIENRKVDSPPAEGLLWEWNPELEAAIPSKAALNSEETTSSKLTLSHFAFLFWAIGLLTVIWYARRNHLGLCKILEEAQPADKSLQEKAFSLAYRFQCKCPEIRVTNTNAAPLVTTYANKQTILLPQALLNTLNPEELETVIAHELAHVRRGDRWVRWFEFCVILLHWWNPLAWWTRNQLEQATESCCDGLVVWKLPNHRRHYGEALFTTIKFLTEPQAPAPFANHAMEAPLFKNRIHSIMKKHIPHRMTSPVKLAIATLAISMLPWAITGYSTNAHASNERAPAPRESNVSSTLSALDSVQDVAGTIWKWHNDYITLKSVSRTLTFTKRKCTIVTEDSDLKSMSVIAGPWSVEGDKIVAKVSRQSVGRPGKVNVTWHFELVQGKNGVMLHGTTDANRKGNGGKPAIFKLIRTLK